MWKIVSLFLFPLILISQELEILLPTRSLKKSIYLSQIKTDPQFADWRYIEEVKEVLEFDLNTGAFLKTLPADEAFESHLDASDAKSRFDLSFWQKQNISYLLSIQIRKNRLAPLLFDIERGASKRYPEIELTQNIDLDRRALHRLSDQLHRDLFGIEGIASLKILYTCRHKELYEEERKSEIWISDFDGKNTKKLIFKEGYCLSPSFFPKSKNSEFFYVAYKDGQSKIYKSSLPQCQDGEPFISLRGSQALPAISPTGSQMAFITDAAGRPDLFIQKLDPRGKTLGKARQIFTAPRASEASPTFSPDGKKVAFVSDKDGPPRIYLLEIPHPKETKKPRPLLLTKKNRQNTSPAWSPDGKKLAYSALTEGIRQIWLYDFETEEEMQLTTGPEMKENPAWAPDSLHLIYNTESEDKCELYLLDIREPHPIQISKGTGQKRFAAWEMRE